MRDAGKTHEMVMKGVAERQDKGMRKTPGGDIGEAGHVAAGFLPRPGSQTASILNDLL